MTPVGGGTLAERAAKLMSSGGGKSRGKGGGARKYKRNRVKCQRYRDRVGKPNGPGMPGQHAHH